MILTGLVLGIVLGIVMQRGRFCVTGMLRDIFLQQSWRTFVALLVVISVHALGLALLTSLGVIAPEYTTFAPAAVVVGSLLFGLGIVLAGGCASGTWYRSAEGLVGSWIALAMYALSAAMMKTGPLLGFNTAMHAWDTGLTTIPRSLGISPWFFAGALAVLTAVLVRHFVGREARLPQPVRLENRPVWKRPIGFYTAGALIGLIGVIAWPLSAATGRNDGLGITTPSSNLVTWLVSGNGKAMNWGTLLVLGLFLGAFVAARATGEFRVRVPDGRTAVRAVAGGLLMGVGASLAGGCTVGNGMVQTSLFSFQGWVALVFIALGVGLGAKLWLKPSAASSPAAETGTYSTGQSIVQDVDDAPAEPATSAQDGGIAPSGDPLPAGLPAAGASGSSGAHAPAGLAPAGFAGFSAAPGAVALAERPVTVSEKLREQGPGLWSLDTMGAVCPFPLIEAKDVMKTLPRGERLAIDFDCTQATEAIPHWAAEDGHEVLDFRETGEASWRITLRKG